MYVTHIDLETQNLEMIENTIAGRVTEVNNKIYVTQQLFTRFSRINI